MRLTSVATLILACLGMAACSLRSGISEQSSQTVMAIQTPTASAQAAVVVTATVATPSTLTATAQPTVTPTTTATSTTSAPTALATTTRVRAAVTPPPTSFSITGPIAIDSERRCIYAPGRVGEQDQTLVLATRDGALLATYPVAGQLALDAVRGWLYVDRGKAGVAVFNTRTGLLQTEIHLPDSQDFSRHAPQADTVNGQGLAFRDNKLYVLDPMKGAISRIITTNVKLRDCVLPLSIHGMVSDSVAQMLYLTYGCSRGEFAHVTAVLSLDLMSGSEKARQEFEPHASLYFTVADGSLYGVTDRGTWPPTSDHSVWAWRDGKPWFISTQWSDVWASSPQLDARRGWVYVTTWGELLVFDADTMALLLVTPCPVGSLAGYDPVTDQLYFVTNEGALRPWPVSAIAPPKPRPLAVATPPSLPVRAIALTRGGQDADGPFVAGVWQHSSEFGHAMILGRSAGDLYLGRRSSGETMWQGPAAGPIGSGPQFTAVVLSPDYARDKLILAGIQGMGVFRSADAGQSWQPSATGLDSMWVDGFLMSNGFAEDRTIFVNPVRGERLGLLKASGRLMRSSDAGRTWQALSVTPCQAALSPEFGVDRTVMVSTGEYPCRSLQISQDGGDTWQAAGQLPGEDPVTLLTLAPLYAKWRVLFALAQPDWASREQGVTLYRSEDGGNSWKAVMKKPLEHQRDEGNPYSAELVYAPGDEAHRAIYLLLAPSFNPGWSDMSGSPPAKPPTEPGKLYVSGDGGQTWQQARLPASLVPTALAMSPNFAQDQLLYLGTRDGRIVPIAAGSLVGQR